MASIYDQHLERNPANFMPLTPLGFFSRSAEVFPNRVAIIDGSRKLTWGETYARCRKLADALRKRGIGKGHTVSILSLNNTAHLEVYFAVPMVGAVINPLNTRLDAAMIAFMLEHSETKLLIVDQPFHGVIGEALARMKSPPTIIDILPAEGAGSAIGVTDYEALISEGEVTSAWHWPDDEWDAISLNYTSGTTGDPKGVVYNHRGAYLNALGNAVAWNMPQFPTYLWTLPMFHASGWVFPWTLAALTATHLCLPKVDAAEIFRLIETHRVTHFTAAPIVLNMLIHAPDAVKRTFDWTVQVMTAGSAPTPTVLENMQKMGFNVMHVYGATEVYGPNMSCAWDPKWDALSIPEQAIIKARQGVRTPVLEDMMVAHHDTMQPVPRDGKTIGECMMRGNVIMKGYLKNPKTTGETFRGGWYHTGDLAVWHPDGYIEVKDRLKDIIISGGENISTIEVESVIYRHPAVLEAAVVAMPHPKWEETPCAFIELKPNAAPVTEDEMIDFCREHMARYKAPTRVVFGALDKTPTGKIQKYVLRQRAVALSKE
jgi:fatty-acyl-CoA synthase